MAERASVGVLVAAAVFELATGLANAAQWYPWSFSFRSTHYAVAWIAIGALVVHIAVKLPVIAAGGASMLRRVKCALRFLRNHGTYSLR